MNNSKNKYKLTIDSDLNDRVQKLKQEIKNEEFEQSLLNHGMRTKLNQFCKSKMTTATASKILVKIESENFHLSTSRNEIQTPTESCLSLRNVNSRKRSKQSKRPRAISPLNSSNLDAKNCNWTNKYVVTRGDWDNDIKVTLERFSVSCRERDGMIQMSEKLKRNRAAEVIQLWYRSYYKRNQVSLAIHNFTANSMMKTRKDSIKLCQLKSPNRVIEEINEKVNNLFQRKKEHESAYIIQQFFKTIMKKYDSIDRDKGVLNVNRMLRRREIRKQNALSMIEQEKAAAQIQAIYRGRIARKKNNWKYGVVRAHLMYILQCENNIQNIENPTPLLLMSKKYNEMSKMDIYSFQKYKLIRISLVLAKNAIVRGYIPNGDTWYKWGQMFSYIADEDRIKNSVKDRPVLENVVECYQNALKTIEVALMPIVWYEYGKSLYNLGLFCKCVSAFQKYCECQHSKFLSKAYWYLGVSFFQIGDYEKAIEMFINSKSTCTLESIIFNEAEYCIIIGRCNELLWELTKKKEYYSKACQIMIGITEIIRKDVDVNIWINNAFLWHNLATKCMDIRAYPLAIDFLQVSRKCFKCVQQDRISGVNAIIARCYVEIFNFNMAITTIENSVQMKERKQQFVQETVELIKASKQSSAFEIEMRKPILQLRKYFDIKI